MAQAITQAVIKAAKTVIAAARDTKTNVQNARSTQQTPQANGPMLKQPNFDWKAPDTYHILNNFEVRVRNIVLTND